MKFRLSNLATADLQDISEYTAEVWGEEQEEKYIHAIFSKFKEIASGKGHSRTRDDLFPSCEAIPVGRHLIIFIRQGDTALISRILHQSMDFPRHVFPLD